MSKDKKDQARALHAAGSNCAQSVLCAFAEDLGVDPIQAHKLTTGMGAGLGRRQLLCGAVSGGVMALGAAFGNRDGSDQEAKERTYEISRNFVLTVEKEFGSAECRTLLGVDLLSEEGKKEFKARGLGAAVCDKIIGRCAELVETILKEQSVS